MHEAEVDPTMQVISSLAAKDFDFRTPEGIARQTGLSDEAVSTVLDELVELGVARHPITQEHQLFTLAAMRPTWRERYRLIRGQVATW
jgi:DNA-binding IclR family transcriptional regulator